MRTAPREFEINISAGVDKIPMIKVAFEGIILNTIMVQKYE